MRIATWNINGLKARREYLELWLQERKPDIVGLQELKMREEDFPHEFFNKLGYQALVYGQKSWNGVAILTKRDAVLKSKGLAGQEDFGARLITAQVADVEFTTCYCPNGKDIDHQDYRAKLNWFDSFISNLQVETAANQIVCGDFNIVNDPIDSWRGESANDDIFHTADERNKMRQIFKTGLIDLFREQNPDEQTFTWWDYRGGAFHRKQGLRIDLILGTEAILKRTRKFVIDRDYRKKQKDLTASDHAPVYIDIE